MSMIPTSLSPTPNSPIELVESTPLLSPSPPLYPLTQSPLTQPPLESPPPASPLASSSSLVPATKETLKMKSSSLEQTFTKNTENLINALKTMKNTNPQPYDYMFSFLRGTLNSISSEKAANMEKEIMQIAFKYKYNTEN